MTSALWIVGAYVLLIAFAVCLGAAEDPDPSFTRANEGCRLTRYTDTTGHATIGIGHRCLRNDHRQRITMADANAQFSRDYRAACDDCVVVLKHSGIDPDTLPGPIGLVCVDMTYALGPFGFATFHRFLDRLRAQDWFGARRELLASRFAAEVPNRAAALADLMQRYATALRDSN